MTVKKSRGIKMNKKLNHDVKNKRISPGWWSSVAREKSHLNIINSISQRLATNNCHKEA